MVNRLLQRMYKINLKYLLVPESEKAFKEHWEFIKRLYLSNLPKIYQIYLILSNLSKEHRSQPSIPPTGQIENNLSIRTLSFIIITLRDFPDVVRSMGQEDPLEKRMGTHSSILARKIPWIEEPGKLQSMGSQESDMT